MDRFASERCKFFPTTKIGEIGQRWSQVGVDDVSRGPFHLSTASGDGWTFLLFLCCGLRADNGLNVLMAAPTRPLWPFIEAEVDPNYSNVPPDDWLLFLSFHFYILLMKVERFKSKLNHFQSISSRTTRFITLKVH